MYRQSEKNLLSSNISSTCPRNMVNFGPLAAEIISLVWGTPTNFNGFCVLAALLHGISVVGVSQTLQRWTEGATYIRQGGHQAGHWPTFLVVYLLWATQFSVDPQEMKTWKSNDYKMHQFHMFHCGLHAAVNPLRPGSLKICWIDASVDAF